MPDVKIPRHLSAKGLQTRDEAIALRNQRAEQEILKYR